MFEEGKVLLVDKFNELVECFEREPKRYQALTPKIMATEKQTSPAIKRGRTLESSVFLSFGCGEFFLVILKF